MESDKSLHEYRQNVPDSLERRVEAWKKTNLNTTMKWQEIFVAERPNWVLSNFNSPEEMNEAMFQFITSMETLELEARTKRRVVYDAAKELNARLTKEERLALINDPSFQPATNSEFKKIAKEREIDQVMKTLDLTSATKEQRKSAQALLKMGMSVDDIKKAIKLA
jgi:myo-inositol-1-phosphate synthase